MSINLTKLDEKLSVTGQISIEDLHEIAESGYKSIICNRPDFEGGADQPTSEQLEKLAKSLGIVFVYLPVEIGGVSAEHGEKFKELVGALPGPILAFCGSGKRATALHGLSINDASVDQHPVSDACNWGNAFDIVVVGGGSAGIGVTASLLKRRPSLRIGGTVRIPA